MVSVSNKGLLIVAAALVLVAAGCGDDTADITQPVSSPVTASSTTAVPADAVDTDDQTTDGDTTTTTTTAAEATETPEEIADSTTTTTTTTTIEATETPEEAADSTTTTTTTTTIEATETPEEAADSTTTTTTTTTIEATETPEEAADSTTTTTTAVEATETPEEAADSTTGGDEGATAGAVEEETGRDVSSESLGDDPVGSVELPVPDRVVVWDGVDSEDRCLVAGGVWTGTVCEYWVFDDPADAGVETYWHPSLMVDAYRAVDPATVEADHWESLDFRGTWGVHSYHVFYHYSDFGDPQVQYESMRKPVSWVAWAFVYPTDWVWFPYRFDVSWSDVPNVVAITGTYPLGEQRTLLLAVDQEQPSGRLNTDMSLPLPPPIRPTTPFTEVAYQNVGEALGRDCPPVEEVWDGYGTEITDPCTLKAVETAVDWAWRGEAALREHVIRDGHAMVDFLQDLESFEDPHENALWGYESRVGGGILVRDVKWAGQWPGASMISLEWNINFPRRDFTPEEYEARVRYRDYLVEQGYDVVDYYLDLSLGEVFLNWAEALIVRTQDGTWRMSQRSFCWWYERIIRADQEEILCPEDPNAALSRLGVLRF